jgi:hypothetical protein
MKRPGEPPADYLEISFSDGVTATDCSTSQTNKSSSDEQNLTNHLNLCHLQKCISPFFMCFKFHENFDSPRYKIGEKGHANVAHSVLSEWFPALIQGVSRFETFRRLYFECKILFGYPRPAFS